jgi:hypothetical protein
MSNFPIMHTLYIIRNKLAHFLRDLITPYSISCYSSVAAVHQFHTKLRATPKIQVP